MTVRELIEKLQEYPPELNVYCQTIWNQDHEYDPLDIYEIEFLWRCKAVKEEEKEDYVGIYMKCANST